MAAPAISSIYGSTGRQAFLIPGAGSTLVNPDVTLPATAGFTTLINTATGRWTNVTARNFPATLAAGTTVTVGAYYGGGFPSTAVNFTADDGIVIEVAISFSGMTGINTLANNGLSALFGTQGGGYQHLRIGGNNQNLEDNLTEGHPTPDAQSLIFAPGGDPDHLIAQSGFNSANVNYCAMFFRYAVSPTPAASTFNFLTALTHGTYRIIEGEVGNPARLKVIYDQEVATATLRTASFRRAGTAQYVSYRSISIGNGTNLVYFVESFSLEMAPDNSTTKQALMQVPDGYLKFKINLTDASTCDISGSRISSGRGLTFVITRIGTATVNFNRLSINGGGGRGNATLLTGYTQTLGLFESLGTVALNGATLTGLTLSNVEQLSLASGDTFSGSYQNASATSTGVVITGAPGSYAFAIAFNNNAGTADLRISPSSAGTFTLNNISVATGYTLKIRNNSATHSIVVAIPAGIITSTTTAGGAIAIIVPQLTLSFTGIPSGAEARISQGSRTLLYESNITDGTFSYVYDIPEEPITYTFVLPGFNIIQRTIPLPSTSQDIALVFEPDPSYI